jgi:hypothetical protein
MFDDDVRKEESSTDWSGTLIGASLLPVLFFFMFIGKGELGFTVCLVLAASIYAVRLRWGLRKHVWFWGTIFLILALHIPLLFMVRWPETSVPTIAYSLPFGIVDFGLIIGGISLAQRIFSKGRSCDEKDE